MQSQTVEDEDDGNAKKHSAISVLIADQRDSWR